MNNRYTCIIVDDEPYAQELLEKHIKKVPFLDLLKICSNAFEAIQAIQTYSPTIVFLDIHMPEMTGLELIKTYSRNRPEIILTTAHAEFACEGFDYDVTDFLLKPISFERFMKAIHKVKVRSMETSLQGASPRLAEEEPLEEVRLETRSETRLPAGLETVPELLPGQEVDRYLWVKEDKKLIQVDSEEIVYVEGMKDYLKIFLRDRMIITHMTMGKIEQLLSRSLFIRVNRSFIVKVKAIKSIYGNTIETSLKKDIPIGINYREVIRKTFGS